VKTHSIEFGSRYVNRKSKSGNSPDHAFADTKGLQMRAGTNIQAARVEPHNRRRSYRAQVRAAVTRRNIAKRGGAR
jgi:hypothetical protein